MELMSSLVVKSVDGPIRDYLAEKLRSRRRLIRLLHMIECLISGGELLLGKLLCDVLFVGGFCGRGGAHLLRPKNFACRKSGCIVRIKFDNGSIFVVFESKYIIMGRIMQSMTIFDGFRVRDDGCGQTLVDPYATIDLGMIAIVCTRKFIMNLIEIDRLFRLLDILKEMTVWRAIHLGVSVVASIIVGGYVKNCSFEDATICHIDDFSFCPARKIFLRIL